MRLIDLGAVYLAIGLVCAVATARRGSATRAPHLGLADAALTVLVWPLYVPVLLGRPAAPEGAAAPGGSLAAIRHEQELLLAALDGAAGSALAALMPTRAQLERLVDHLAMLDGKVAELDQVLARQEFDAGDAERALRSAERRGGHGVESARLVCESIRRLAAMRDRAAGERDELLALCAQLRTQVTVLRFAGEAERDDVGELVGEILARVEGVGAALEPRLEKMT